MVDIAIRSRRPDPARSRGCWFSFGVGTPGTALVPIEARFTPETVEASGMRPQSEAAIDSIDDPAVRRLGDLVASATLVGTVFADRSPLGRRQATDRSLPDRSVRYAPDRLDVAELVETRDRDRDAPTQVFSHRR